MERKKMRNLLIKLSKSESEYVNARPISYSQLVFEERVRLNCFYCPNHGINWMCPPNTPNIDYRLVLKEYSELLLVYGKIPFQEPMHEFLRRESSNILHRILLKAEKLLWENDYPLAVSFTGGSCKLCAKGCDPQGCRQPNIARIPLESTGINVIKSAKNIGIDVVFPPREYIYRLGLLGW